MASNKKAKKVQVKFDNDSFSSIVGFLPELAEKEGYAYLGEEDFAQSLENALKLGFKESSLEKLAKSSNDLIDFLRAVSAPGEPKLNEVMAVQTRERVVTSYPPGLFAASDGSLILVVGGNMFPVTQDDSDFEAGPLSGELVTQEVKVAGQATWTKIGIKFEYNASESEVIYYTVFGVNNRDNKCPEQTVLDAVNNGESISQFLAEFGSGGGRFAKLRDLEIGSHLLAGTLFIPKPADPEKPHYSDLDLVLADGRQVSPNVALKRILTGHLDNFDGDYDELSRHINGACLVIASKKPSKNGVTVTCDISWAEKLKGGYAPSSNVLPPVQQPKQTALPESQTVDVPSVMADEEVEKALEEYPGL
jgi:hypothetical protein